MYKPESTRENEIDKILYDFEIQTDHLISARRQDLVIINKSKKKKKKKNLSYCGFCHPSRPQSEKSKKTKRETSTWTMLDN